MDTSKPFRIILHVRVPAILEGRDHQRYLERKLRDSGLRLRPPPTLIGTDVPVGYGLIRPGADRWHVVEARGEIPTRLHVIGLHEHPLVEDVLDEALEDERRAIRAAEWAELCRLIPELGETDGRENITAGGPMPGPLAMNALKIGMCILAPFAWAGRGVLRLRRWYVREYG